MTSCVKPIVRGQLHKGALLLLAFVPGTLLSALHAVLTTKRRLQLRVRALTAQEVAVQLSFKEPVYAEQVSVLQFLLNLVSPHIRLIDQCISQFGVAISLRCKTRQAVSRSIDQEVLAT